MNLFITNQCNRNCPFCFEGDSKSGGHYTSAVQEMSLENIRAFLDKHHFFFKYLCPCGEFHWRQIKLLGGEPTLHSQFDDVLELLLTTSEHTGHYRYVSSPEDILILTNGIISADRARSLCGFRRTLNVSVDYTPEEESVLRNTIDIWESSDSHASAYSLTVTLMERDQDFTLLKEILREAPSIAHVRPSVASPGLGFRNRCALLAGKENHDLGRALLRLIQDIREIRPDMGLSIDCYMNDEIADEETYVELQKQGIGGLKKICVSGSFDILPDMSATWCFPFADTPEMKIENVLEYDDIGAAVTELQERFYAFCKKSDYNPFGCTAGCILKRCYQRSLEDDGSA